MSQNDIYAARSRVGVAARRGDVAATEQARAELALAKAKQKVRDALALLGDPTPSQRRQLVRVLKGGE